MQIKHSPARIWLRYSTYALLILIAGLVYSCKSSKKRKVAKRPTPTVTRPMTSNEDTKPNPTVIEDNGDTPVIEEKVESAASKRAMKVNQVLNTADTYLGTKHRMGGMSKKGIDCSGLVVMSYKSIELALPRTTSGQMNAGKPVKITELQVGDLVFFTYPGGQKVTHVGIVKEVRGPKDVIFIHTSSSKGVRDDNVFDNYWRSNFLGARRVL